MIYTAPGKKPKPNKAIVVITREEFMVWVPRPCMYDDGYISGKGNDIWKIPKKCGKHVPGPGSVEAVITIVDRGYKATGTEGDIVFSGQICSLEEPFTVFGSGMNSKVNFKPSSPTEGTYTTTQSGYAVGATSTGTYKIVGADTDKPRIVFTGSGTATGPPGTVTTSGTGYGIDLVPLTGNECGGG